MRQTQCLVQSLGTLRGNDPFLGSDVMNPVRSHQDSSVAQLLGFQIQEDVVSYNVTCHILPYLAISRKVASAT